MLRVHLALFLIRILIQNQCNCQASSKPLKHCSKISCFMFVDDKKLNWDEANTWCNTSISGANLATIRNENEQRLIKDTLPVKEQGFWIGLNDRESEGDFKWVDGTSYGFKSWNGKEPNGKRGENCVEVFIDKSNTDAKWNDKSCETRSNFICMTTKQNDELTTKAPSSTTSAESTTPSILISKTQKATTDDKPKTKPPSSTTLTESSTPSTSVTKPHKSKTGTLAPGAFPVAAVASSLVSFLIVAAVLTTILLWRARKRKQPKKENDDKEFRISLELEPKDRQEDDDCDNFRADDEIMIHQVSNAINLNVLKTYYTQMNEESLFGAQYRSIITPGSPTKIVAGLLCNKIKNRYANIGAYDHSRVILSEDPQVEGSDYINANYIDSYNFSKRYIAAMGPKPETVNDFWKMVWEQKTNVIVMLTKTMEMGKVKCQQYWPNKGHAFYHDARIELISVQETLNFEIRKLQLSMQSEPNEEARTILHYYFTAWPDHNVPNNATGILDLRRQVNAAIKSQDTGPIIVHCSAGIGRTGTYIAIDASLNQIREEGTMPDVLGFITYMRGQRNNMVQTENQYKFIHTAILEAVAFDDSEISATDLRQVVRKFNEVNPSNGKTHIEEQFELLDGVFPKESNPDQDAAIIGKAESADQEVVPYEFNRVLLSIMPGKEITFINASFIGGFQSKRGFIATEAPLADKVNDFWRMVWERNVQTIVMIAKLNERYKRSMITRYWPDEESEVYGNFTIYTLKTTNKGPYIERELEMKCHKTKDVRKIMHFHFFRWPLLTSPEDSSMVLDLIHDVQNAQHFTGQRPILVHCSDGAGRTGAFCCLYTTLERLKVEGTVDILMTARLLRTQRPRMISTLEQFKFCYKAVIAYLDSFNQYSNFEVKVFK